MINRSQRASASRNRTRSVALFLVGFVALAGCRSAQRPVLTLSVAASLQDTITQIESSYQQEHGPVEFRNNFASSGTLAREIEDGAPVDAMISAGEKEMDALQSKRLLVPGTRANLLVNSLVLIAPKDSTLQGFDGLTSGKVRIVALGDPATVPAGQYGLETLKNLNLYDKIKPKIVLGKDVRQVLAYVETGNADAGLVYATDALISNKVRVVAVAPASSHAPIVYPMAVIARSGEQRAASDFLKYLRSAAARAIFVKHGFTMA